MPAIEVNGLTKAFRTYKKQPGFSGAVKGLFRRQYEQTIAVNDVSFKISRRFIRLESGTGSDCSGWSVVNRFI